MAAKKRKARRVVAHPDAWRAGIGRGRAVAMRRAARKTAKRPVKVLEHFRDRLIRQVKRLDEKIAERGGRSNETVRALRAA